MHNTAKKPASFPLYDLTQVKQFNVKPLEKWSLEKSDNAATGVTWVILEQEIYCWINHQISLMA